MGERGKRWEEEEDKADSYKNKYSDHLFKNLQFFPYSWVKGAGTRELAHFITGLGLEKGISLPRLPRLRPVPILETRIWPGGK